jgi:GNAT superfamily N-acetyltransferase
MQHRISIDGCERVIDIRAMDEDFIVYRKMYQPPLTRDNIGKVNPGDWAEHLEKFRKNGWQELIKEFLRKQICAIGSCAILAWDGDGVIGKMYFSTKELWDACRKADCWLCVENESMPKFIQSLSDSQLAELLHSPTRTLRIICYNIGHQDERYHGHGIARAMIEYLKQWASQRGWRRLIAEACPDITPTMCCGPNNPRRGQLERCGFHVLEESRIPPKEAEWRLGVIEELIAGKRDWPAWAAHYVQNFERILASNPSWRAEYDKEYLMVCTF